MKTILALAALLAAGTVAAHAENAGRTIAKHHSTVKATVDSQGRTVLVGRRSFWSGATAIYYLDKGLTVAHFKEWFGKCDYQNRMKTATEWSLYGQFGDYAALAEDGKNCLGRHGIGLQWKQKDGRLTGYEYAPAYLDY